jgi:hypothetical protein
VFENRVLTKIFRPKRDEMIGGRRKLHNEELRIFYSSPCIIRMIKARMRWAGHVGSTGEKINAYRMVVGKPKEKRLLGIPRRERIILKWLLQR